MHTPIAYTAAVEAREGRRLTLSATSHAGEDLLAEARGSFVVQQHLEPARQPTEAR